jgi:hypothetical protein
MESSAILSLLKMRRITRSLINGELERIWKEMVAAKYMCRSGILCGKITEKHECPFKTDGALLEIRNMYLTGRSLESYCSISQPVL